MYHTYQRYFKAFVIGIIMFSWHTSNAQIFSSVKVPASNNSIAFQYTPDTAFSVNLEERVYTTPIIEPSSSTIKNARERRKLLAYLKKLNVPEDFSNYNSHQKFYYHLADLFAHLKLYPLAMKCFLKTQANANTSQLIGDTAQLNTENLAISSQDDSVINRQAIFQLKDVKEIASKKIKDESIYSIFNDGKTAIAYAMLFHVKQPVRGKPKIFKGANTGHTFITLIKYNADSTYASASFGFYPVKDQLLSATPLVPTTSATFKDDSGHQWDEVLGKFISSRKFYKILMLTKDYSVMKYNLSKNNCTDFGIKAASIAGIKVIETSGKWPLGSGNNPGVTGQSILQGKYLNTDAKEFKDLFVDTE